MRPLATTAPDRVYVWTNAACLALITLAGLYAMHAEGYDFAGDDAFISFVYADSLASGDGLVFNPGEYVWGFTSPLQTLLLGAVSFAGFDLVVLAPRLALVWVGLTSVVVFQLLRRFFAGPLCLLVSLHLATAFASASALETSLLIFLQCSFLLLVGSGHARSAALVAALACLTRPDSVLLVVPGLLLTRATRTLPCLALFALPGLAWVAFAWLYYGDVLPNSLHAKQGLTSASAYLSYHLASFTRIGWPEELSFLTSWLTGPPGQPRLPALALYALLALCVLLDRRVRASAALAHALLIYPWILLLGYALIGSIKFHDWEIQSGLFFAHLAAVLGVVALAQRGIERWPARRGAILAVIASVSLPIGTLDALRFHRSIEGARAFSGMGVRHDAYRRISRWINLNVPVVATLSALEVGTIGYYTKVHLIDVAGIVTRGHLPEERMDHAAFARRFEPDYVLMVGNVEEFRASPTLVYRRAAYFPGRGFASFSILARSEDEGIE
jgi:hypothetical protein